MSLSILIKPIMTEKSMHLSGKGWYTFKVNLKSTKKQIAKIIETQYKVNVIAIKTMIMKGKAKKTGKKRIMVIPSSWKKALIRLKKDQKIAAFSFTETK